MLKRINKKGEQTVRQQRIMKVAITLFAEKGYANTSTAEIARMAEVAEGTIFKHYGTKENLLLSIMIPFLKDFFPSMLDEVMEEIMTDEITFEELTRTLLKNRIDFIHENKEIFQVFMKEIIYRENLKEELLPHLLTNASIRLSKMINIFQKRGAIIDMPTESILSMLSTFLSGFFISRFILLNKQSISDAEVEEMVRFILHGIGK